MALSLLNQIVTALRRITIALNCGPDCCSSWSREDGDTLVPDPKVLRDDFRVITGAWAPFASRVRAGFAA